MKRVGWGLAITALVLAAAAPALRSDGGAAVAAAASQTAEEGSFRVRIAQRSVPADGTAPAGILWSAEGLIDYRSGHGVLLLDMGVDGTGELRLMGDTAFLQMEATALGGRSWMKLDLREDQVPPAIEPVNIGGNDVRPLLDALGGVAGGVENLGPGHTGGVETIRYRGKVDLALAGQRAEAGGKNLGLLSRQLGHDHLDLETWIDPQGRARRVVYYLPPPRSAPADATSATLDIELFDFGVEVDVEAPPTSDVTVFGQLEAD